ncbi:MAG: DUF2202 domain-containing protein [Ignavibacteriales bacterium]|nr:DUF2202 domain-containing protein [Ignavibacteriota bacterium]MCB9248909.1 DUF2202 domain-containing protein [Ignavibacteriales bacterium]
MDTITKRATKFLVTILSAVFILTACNSPVESNNNMYDQDIAEMLKAMPVEEISPAELEGLLFMREEEKLARDVYIVLYQTWNMKVFNNISQSEQKHTDAIKMLLDRYSIEDPVTTDEVGVFQNEDLLALYNTLIEQGKTSLVEALKVGAAIEEIDILDLHENIALVDNEDITFVYENLTRGSRNHLRAFVRNLSSQGVEYQPQYLDETEFQSIISSETENGKGRGRGRK